LAQTSSTKSNAPLITFAKEVKEKEDFKILEGGGVQVDVRELLPERRNFPVQQGGGLGGGGGGGGGGPEEKKARKLNREECKGGGNGKLATLSLYYLIPRRGTTMAVLIIWRGLKKGKIGGHHLLRRVPIEAVCAPAREACQLGTEII